MIYYRVISYYIDMPKPPTVYTSFGVRAEAEQWFEYLAARMRKQSSSIAPEDKVLAVVLVSVGEHERGPHKIYKVESDCGLDWLAGKLKEITL